MAFLAVTRSYQFFISSSIPSTLFSLDEACYRDWHTQGILEIRFVHLSMKKPLKTGVFVSAERFELSTNGLKGRCSAVELRAQHISGLHSNMGNIHRQRDHFPCERIDTQGWRKFCNYGIYIFMMFANRVLLHNVDYT